MKKKYLILIISIIISCQEEKVKKNIEIEPYIGLHSDKKLSDFIDHIEYIPLETSPEYVLDGIMDITYTGEVFITFDVSHCFVFNQDGKFIKSIGKKGKGPLEYLTPHNGFFSPVNEHIYFPATNNNTIKEFSINGEWVSSNPNPDEGFLHVRNISPSLFAGYKSNITGNAAWNLMIFNQHGDTLFTIPNHYKYKATSYNQFNDEAVFYYYDKSLYFKELYNDTIFQFHDDGTFTTHFVINSGKFKVPGDIKADFQTFLKTFSNNFFSINNILESSNYLIISYLHKKKNNLLFINKQTGNADNYNSKINHGLLNDWDGGANFFPISIKENYLIQIVNIYELKQHVASDAFINSSPKYPKKKKELIQLANSLDENDNPMLMIVKLKD